MKQFLTWDDFLKERMRREDEAVRLRYVYYTNLGRGHLRQDICKVKEY